MDTFQIGSRIDCESPLSAFGSPQLQPVAEENGLAKSKSVGWKALNRAGGTSALLKMKYDQTQDDKRISLTPSLPTSPQRGDSENEFTERDRLLAEESPRHHGEIII